MTGDNQMRRCLFTTALLVAAAVSSARAEIIRFDSFPNGDPIPNETRIRNQFESLGVTFEPLFPNGPRVLTALGGILISGGPTGFFDDLGIDFSVPVSVVTVDIIGSGLDIAARLKAFDRHGRPLGATTHVYTGPTGLPSSFSLFAPAGKTVSRLLFNGGLNPSAAASIDTLDFAVRSPTPEPNTALLVLGAVGLLWKARRSLAGQTAR